MSNFLRRSIRPLFGLGLFAVALFVLDRQLQAHSLAQVTQQLQSIPDLTLLLAIGLAVASEAVDSAEDEESAPDEGDVAPTPDRSARRRVAKWYLGHQL